MKRILLVSYYFEPYNIVASNRINAFAKYLSEIYEVVVITRSWTGSENGISDILVENRNCSNVVAKEGYRVFRLPFIHYLKQVSRLQNKYNYYFGTFQDTPFVEENFLPFLTSHLVYERNSYDLILYSCNPYQLIQVARQIHSQTGIKYIIDFRDFINTDFLKKKISLRQAFYKKIMLFRLRSLLSPASALITVSAPIVIQLKNVYKGPVELIYNGFMQEHFTALEDIPEDKNAFTIIYTGNISPEMEIEVFMEGLRNFLQNGQRHIKLIFVGLSKEALERINLYQDIIKPEFIPWMPQKKALQLAKRASVLLYMGWKGYEGVFSGKIFDYLGLKRNILLCPGDYNVLDKLLAKTNAGRIANNPREVSQILEQWYEEWSHKGRLRYEGIEKEVKVYKRRTQVKKLHKLIERLINAS